MKYLCSSWTMLKLYTCLILNIASKSTTEAALDGVEATHTLFTHNAHLNGAYLTSFQARLQSRSQWCAQPPWHPPSSHGSTLLPLVPCHVGSIDVICPLEVYITYHFSYNQLKFRGTTKPEKADYWSPAYLYNRCWLEEKTLVSFPRLYI